MKRVLTIVLIIAGAGALYFGRSLWKPRTAKSSTALVESGYLGGLNSASSNKSVCVVFVHGIFGDDSSWGKGDVSLPKLLASDPQLSSMVDIFLFEYSSPWLSNASKIPDLAAQLRGALEDNQVWTKHKQVIFVAHSMGGLIVRQDLITEGDHVLQVPMLYFYAVPTNGAAVTDVARHISDNPQLRGMLPLEGNDFLDAVMIDWLADERLKRIKTFCAFESLDTDGIRIVPQSSALSLCTEVADPFTADHIQIVKPQDSSDPKYTRLAAAIKKSLQSNIDGDSGHSTQTVPVQQSTTGKGSPIIDGVRGNVDILIDQSTGKEKKTELKGKNQSAKE